MIEIKYYFPKKYAERKLGLTRDGGLFYNDEIPESINEYAI